MALLNDSDINWRSHVAASLALVAIGTPQFGLAPDRRAQKQ
jgi:hypothetical protein